MSLVPGCASSLAPMQLVGPELELWLASGFIGARPAGAALGRAHSPCLASCSRSARRTAVGQEALEAPGPRVKLPPGLRPASLDPPQRGSLLVKQFVGQENPVSGLPGTLWIEGPGDWLAGVGPSKGVLSSAPTPVGVGRTVGRTASASCRQQLAQTRAQAMRWPPPVHWRLLSALPASSWVKWPAGASGSRCPLQVTWQLSPSWETPVLGGGRRGPQTPRGQLHRGPASSSTKELAGSEFPSQQPLRCREKTKSLPWGKQSWQQETQGRAAVEKEHAQPRQGAFPGPLTCCQGPGRAAPASILTRVGAGSQASSGPFPPLQSCPDSPEGLAGSRPPAHCSPHQRFLAHTP